MLETINLPNNPLNAVFSSLDNYSFGGIVSALSIGNLLIDSRFIFFVKPL